MTLPVSGIISLGEIVQEFGGPGNLLSYYNGGSFVQNTTGTIGPVPSSGKITIQNFYGSQKLAIHAFLSHTSGTETVPANVGNVCIEVWGAGGGPGYNGGSANGGGGGAGGYVRINVAVAVGQTFNYVVGTGGFVIGSGSTSVTGSNGGNSSVSTASGPTVSLLATGGKGGTGAAGGGAGGVGTGSSSNTNGNAGQASGTNSSITGHGGNLNPALWVFAENQTVVLPNSPGFPGTGLTPGGGPNGAGPTGGGGSGLTADNRDGQGGDGAIIFSYLK